MLRKSVRSLVLLSFLVPGLAGAAVIDEDFVLATTQNLVNLCAVSADDPRAKEAIQMCEGYMLGFPLSQLGQETIINMACLPTTIFALPQWGSAAMFGGMV